jgi:hypothetical protein
MAASHIANLRAPQVVQHLAYCLIEFVFINRWYDHGFGPTRIISAIPRASFLSVFTGRVDRKRWA